ncbi:MAG: hypothetical protein WKF48_06535 [Solirubrobacteraceae bacterium]
MIIGDGGQARRRIGGRIGAEQRRLLDVRIGRDEQCARAGEVAVGGRARDRGPRGVPHAFLVTSPTARVLTLQTTGSAEAFYRGASEPAGDDDDGSGPPDFDRVRASAASSGGMQLLGPPPFARP